MTEENFDVKPDMSTLATPELWLAKDLIESDGLDTRNDDPLIQICGNCGHELVAYHSNYSGESDGLREVMCPKCEAALFRHSSVIASKGAARNIGLDYIQSYIHSRADMEFWKGNIAVPENVENEMAILNKEGKLTTRDKKISLEGAIDWKPHCPVCGKKVENGEFDFHHWDYENDTGVMVCRECHNYIHEKFPKNEKLKQAGDEWKEDAIRRTLTRAEMEGELMWQMAGAKFNIPKEYHYVIKEVKE